MREFDLEKKKKRPRMFAGRYLGVSLLLAGALAAGMKLPLMLMEWQDTQRVGRSELLQAQEVVLTTQGDMSLAEKIRFIQSEGVSNFPMTNGRRYTIMNVGEHIREELEKLKDQGILWDYGEYSFSIRAEAIFNIDTEDSERSLMIWQGTAISDICTLNVTMDDESGKILSIYQRFQNFSRLPGSSSVGTDLYTVVEKNDSATKKWAGEILAAWAEYLECTLLETDEAGGNQEGNTMTMDSSELEAMIHELEAQGLETEEAYVEAMRRLGLEVSDEADERNFYGTLEDDRDKVLYQVYLDSDGRGMGIFFE